MLMTFFWHKNVPSLPYLSPISTSNQARCILILKIDIEYFQLTVIFDPSDGGPPNNCSRADISPRPRYE